MIDAVPPNKRLELAGLPGPGSVDRLMDREAEVERRIASIQSLGPQPKRGRWAGSGGIP